MINNLSEGIDITAININPIYLWLGFSFIILLVAIVSGVLVYHWSRYMVKKKVAKTVIIVYFSGLAVMIGFLAWGLNSFIYLL